MDFNGDAALHHAVCRGNVAIASILLEYKANVYAKTEYGLTPYKLALYEQQHEMAEFLIKNGADAHSECTPNSGGTAAEESEQTEKKYVHFNKEENFSTDPMPSCSAVRPAGEQKSVLKKSIQISGDNGRNKDQLSLRLSENPDVPASITEDKASTSDIKEDIENSSCRYTNEDHSQQSDGRHPRKCGHHSEGAHSHCEGPQRNPPEGLQSHQCRAEPSWEEEEEAPGRQVVGQQEGAGHRQNHLQPRSEHDQGCYPGLPLQDEIIQKQNFYSKKIAATKKREQAVLYKSMMDISSLGEAMPAFPRKKSCLMVEKKNTDSFVGAAYPHDVVPQPLAHADSVSSHASDRGDALDPAHNAADPTDHTMNTHSMVFPIGTANMLLLLLASIIWLVKFMSWVMMWVLNLF